MAKNDVAQKVTDGNGAGTWNVVRSALERKEFVVPAVVGVAGAAAAAAAVKDPSLVRGLSGSVEEKMRSTVQGVGAKAAASSSGRKRTSSRRGSARRTRSSSARGSAGSRKS